MHLRCGAWEASDESVVDGEKVLYGLSKTSDELFSAGIHIA